LPFIASGFALRFYLLCDEWWIPKWYWELRRSTVRLRWQRTVRGAQIGLFAGCVLPHRRHRGLVRRVGHQVTMDNGGGALQGTGVCVARAPYGVRCHPCPLENLEISPLRLLHCFRGSHPLRTRARHLCARSAGLTRRRKIPPSAEPRHLVVCGGRRSCGAPDANRC
jgi:hypothetical protein